MPLSVIVAVLAECGVDATTVRTAIARLTRDGWLVRERRGRRSDYRLDSPGLSTFTDAGERIYARNPPAFAERWALAITTLNAGKGRKQLRSLLRNTGFGALDDTVFLRPENRPMRPLPDAEGVHFLRTETAPGPLPPALLERAFDLVALDALYQQFIADVDPWLEPPAPDDGAQCAALRTLLIHAYRRVVLRDPQLPDDLAPTLVHRARARDTAARLYRRWTPRSEHWLDSATDTPWLADGSATVSARF